MFCIIKFICLVFRIENVLPCFVNSSVCTVQYTPVQCSDSETYILKANIESKANNYSNK